MDDPREMFLASIWKYTDAGILRVLEALKARQPAGRYTFDAENNWFKVICPAGDLHDVQAAFRQVHQELEAAAAVPVPGVNGTGVGSNAVVDNNPYLRRPTPTELYANDAEHDKVPASATTTAKTSTAAAAAVTTTTTTASATATAAAADHQCPVAFDQYPFTKVWPRVKEETPDTVSVYTFLGAEDSQAIAAQSGATLAFDVAGRLVYLGGASRDSVDTASKMLDNLFNRFTYVLPPPKHLLYAETENTCRVDARFAAHINETLLTSAIFDPGQYPNDHLDRIFRAVFAKGVCLRICLYDRFKRAEVSFFGPKAQPIFHDPARRWPKWSKKTEYAPKVLGVTAPKKEPEKAPPSTGSQVLQPRKQEQQHGQQQQPKKEEKTGQQDMRQRSEQKATKENKLPAVNVARPEKKGTAVNADTESTNWLADQVDLLAVGFPLSTEKTVPFTEAPESSTSSSVAPTSAPTTPSPPPPPPPPPPLDSGKYSYQMRMLYEFMNGSAKKTTQAGSQSAKLPLEANKKTTRENTHENGHKSAQAPAVQSQPQLITTLDDDAGDNKVVDASSTKTTEKSDIAESAHVLIAIDDAPPQRQATINSSKKGTSVSKASDFGKAVVRHNSFLDGVYRSIGQLVSDLPYSKGRIRLQAELGRIYIMDASSEGLAHNLPGEPSSGWTAPEIATRLNTVCVSPDSVVFTKVLSIFANDIESVIEAASSPANPILVSPTSNGGGGGGGGGGSELAVGLQPSPEWSHHDKRVVYELKCQRFFIGSDGTTKPRSPFVVEIDGTEPGAFTYTLRSVEDTRPPVWVHCIRRHWDARVIVSYSQTDKLEKTYGEFARELFRTMVVPPRTVTSPKFQVRYDHRVTKVESRSFCTKVLSARVRNVNRFISRDQASFLDVSWTRHMTLEQKPDKADRNLGTILAAAAADNPTRGAFSSWYEMNVVSARAEAAFRENETLAPGETAAWGSSRAEQDEMFEATLRPALELVQKMDGVGVLIDNGQGDMLYTPPMTPSSTAQASSRFW
ncbi:hypothetical protein SPI_06809 [Niveomyces insectorum RCEF 264]|uniref:Uncharacterized protein n=1 Tax=Niveomyces insectorum RCEF 264 TaxID=1081102 RepID=A0A167QSC1_9HYPO|nr:hypothetical protein SPI_06809 [Niveomyces insectorum RCEF 264]